jgi:hypothetical protein
MTYDPVDTTDDGVVDADVDNQSLTTDEANITNETFIRAERSSASNSTSTGTRINIFDTAVKDVRGEFNGSAQFEPDESGEYLFIIHCEIDGAGNPGDEVRCVIWDVTNSTVLQKNSARASITTIGSRVNFVFSAALSAGDTYEVRAANNNSSYEIGTTTEGEIIRSVVA